MSPPNETVLLLGLENAHLNAEIASQVQAIATPKPATQAYTKTMIVVVSNSP